MLDRNLWPSCWLLKQFWNRAALGSFATRGIMNVIRQPKRGGAVGPRPFAMGTNKPKGRGRGALDFDLSESALSVWILIKFSANVALNCCAHLVQYRPGQRHGASTSSDGEMRTPSNLQLQRAITSSAHRTSSTSIQTSSGNNSSSSHFAMGPPPRGNQNLERWVCSEKCGLCLGY